jgi:hypothetical protein
MISINETTLNGLRGQEISFYTGEDIKENIFLHLPIEMYAWTPSGKLTAQTRSGLGFNLINGFAASLCMINDVLKSIYINFDLINSPDTIQKFAEQNTKDSQDTAFTTVNITSKVIAKFHMDIQSLFYFLKKACYAVVLIKADKIIPRDGEMPPTIRSLFEQNYHSQFKDRVAQEVYVRRESIEVFGIIEDIADVFQSLHMYTMLGSIGRDFPTAYVFGKPANKDYAFLLHNHDIRQIVKGVDIALKDVNIL